MTQTKESIFYDWACDLISNEAFKAMLLRLHNCTVDLRQPDKGNWIDVVHVDSGEIETIYC